MLVYVSIAIPKSILYAIKIIKIIIMFKITVVLWLCITFKITSFLPITLFALLCVRFDILFTCENHLHDCIHFTKKKKE